MRFFNILSFIALSVVLFSCARGLNQEQEKKITQLEARVDSTLEVISKLDTAKGLASANHFFENMDYIKHEMTDTISREMAFYIDKYYSTRKSFKYFGNQYPKVYEELSLCKEQLANLRHDAENGLLEEGQFEKYYHLEANNLVLAEETANEVVEAINTVQPMYDEMNPTIDSLIEASRKNAKASNE